MAPYRMNGNNFFLAARTRVGDLACRLGLKGKDPKEISWSKVFPRSGPLRLWESSCTAWGDVPKLLKPGCNDQLLSLYTALAVQKMCQLFQSRLWNAAHAHGRHVLSTPIPVRRGLPLFKRSWAPRASASHASTYPPAPPKFKRWHIYIYIFLYLFIYSFIYLYLFIYMYLIILIYLSI